ncbi:hypothetical protein [Bradyrhizobium liaoningense]
MGWITATWPDPDGTRIAGTLAEPWDGFPNVEELVAHYQAIATATHRTYAGTACSPATSSESCSRAPLPAPAPARRRRRPAKSCTATAQGCHPGTTLDRVKGSACRAVRAWPSWTCRPFRRSQRGRLQWVKIGIELFMMRSSGPLFHLIPR